MPSTTREVVRRSAELSMSADVEERTAMSITRKLRHRIPADLCEERKLSVA